MKRTEKEVFTEKAKTYVVCNSNECPIRNHCLRRMLSTYVRRDRLVQDCVNVLNPETETTTCPMFRSDQHVMMKRGMKTFYDEMPQKMAYVIRKKLLSHYGTNNYYRMRSGELPVTPAMQQHIEQVCRNAGWMLPPAYDRNAMEYEWEKPLD